MKESLVHQIDKNIKNISLGDLKKLLEKLKKKSSLLEEDFKVIDKDKKSESNLEKKLYQEVIGAKNTLVFLEELINFIEKKKKLVTNNLIATLNKKNSGENNKLEDTNNKDKNYINSNRWEGKNNINEKQNEILKEKDKEVFGIISKYNSLTDLLNNKQGRKSILEIDYPESSTCPKLKFKNGEEIDLSKLKIKVAKAENKEIARKLKGTLMNEKLKKVLNGTCKSEKLRQKLKESGKFTDLEIEEIISQKELTRKTVSQIFLRNKLGKGYVEFLKIGGIKERKAFLEKKGFSKEEQKEILENLYNLKDSTKKEIEATIKLIEYGIEGYSKLELDYFIKNIEDIKYISDINKLKAIIKYISGKNINLLKNEDLNKIVNIKFAGDINFLEFYSNTINKKLSLFDVRNFYEKRNLTKFKRLIKILDKDSIFHIVIKILKANKGNAIENNKYWKIILNNVDNNLKSKIRDLKIVYKSTDLIDVDKNTLIDKFNKNTISKNELILLDNYLFNNLNSNIDFILKIIKNTPKKIVKLTLTFEKIKTDINFIDKLIDKNLDIYGILPYSIKNKLALKYIEKILKKVKDKDKAISYIVEVRFNKIEDKQKIFSLLKKENIDLQKVFSNPRFKIFYKDFLDKNKDNKEYINSEMGENTYKENNAINSSNDKIKYITGVRNKYNQEMQRYYKKNNGDKTKKIDINWNILNKHIKNTLTKLMGYFGKLPKEKYLKPLVHGYLSAEIAFFKEGAKESEKAIITLLSQINELGIDKKGIEIILKERNKLLEDEHKRELKEISKKTISKDIQNILKKIVGENGKINEKMLTYQINKFIAENKVLKGKNGKEYLINSKEGIKLAIQKFSEILGLNKIGGKDKGIKEKIIKIFEGKIILVKKKQQTKKENYDKFYEGVKTGDFKEYEQKARKTYFKDVEEEIKTYEESDDFEKDYGNTGETKYFSDIKNNDKKVLVYDNYSYNPEKGYITVSNDNGIIENIDLTSEEKKLIKEDKEMIKKIGKFYNILAELGLKKLWSQKESIFRVIENVAGISFRVDSDYLNENEVKIFFNYILKSVGEKTIPQFFSLKSFIGEIKKINKFQTTAESAKIENSFYGETYLENKFFNKFVGRNSSIINFKLSKFEKAITQS